MLDTPLDAIANEEGSDKGTVAPTGFPPHNYTDVYAAYLAPLRKEPITLLEVGLGVDGPNWHAEIAWGRNAQGGASLRMWYRYLPHARLFGLDINPAAVLDNDRIRTGVVDQSKPDQITGFLAEAGMERLDVIIDDGSHRPDHQQITLGTLFPYLAPGGLYFIEDLMANGQGDGMRNQFSCKDVLSTRRVLQGFCSDGSFPEPNALVNSTALGEAIDSIAFHVPRATVVGVPAPDSPRGLNLRRIVLRIRDPRRGRRLRSERGPTTNMRVRYLPDEPTLCAIRKTPNAPTPVWLRGT